jgi:hypothetical protein
MSGQEIDVRGVADALIAATNALDVACALSLFAPDAVIDDPSSGHRFDGHAGIREYIERYFIGDRCSDCCPSHGDGQRLRSGHFRTFVKSL